MKSAIDSFLKGADTGDTGTASPSYASDMSLAGEDDMEEESEGGIMEEVKGMLETASPSQLEEVKKILSATENPGAGAVGGPGKGGPGSSIGGPGKGSGKSMGPGAGSLMM
jgi:hypothetical protein